MNRRQFVKEQVQKHVEPAHSIDRATEVGPHEKKPDKHEEIVEPDKEEELLEVDSEEDAEDEHSGEGEE